MKLSVCTLYTVFFTFTFLLFTTKCDAQHPKKWALIIGIGKYQTGNGWPTLHGDNDADLLKQTLNRAGFDDNNITTLKSENATKSSIIKNLKELIDKVSPGDFVLFHFSGHGQQIQDFDGDEPDGLDECLVPFDAPSEDRGANAGRFDASKHLTDDELGNWFTSVRNKLGEKGKLVAFIDACHSGTTSRGSGIIRGGKAPIISDSVAFRKGIAKDKNATKISSYYKAPLMSNDGKSSKFVLIAATKAEEPDYEYREQQVGSLSFAIKEAFLEHTKDGGATFRDLFEYIRSTMSRIVPFQTPQAEGDLDLQIFGGDIVIQEPYFTVRYLKEKTIEINGGKLIGISKGALIGIYPIGTRSIVGLNPSIVGTVVSMDMLKSKVQLDSEIPIDSLQKMNAFMIKKGPTDLRTKVFIGDLPMELKSTVSKQLNLKQIVLVQTPAEATLLIEKAAQGSNMIRIVSAIEGLDILPPFDATKPVNIFNCQGNDAILNPADYIISMIKNYSVNGVIKNSDYADKDFNLKIEILSATVNEGSNKETITGSKSSLDHNFNTINDKAVLKITNTGLASGYVYVVEFDPSGKMCLIAGFDTEIRLEPGKKYEQDIPGFAPPLGRYIVKGFITETQIGSQLKMIFAQQGNARSGVLSKGFLEDLNSAIDNPTQSRGQLKNENTGGSTSTFSYTISE